MKIIKVILFSFLALILIAGTGIFILFQTFDTDQYLPQITQKASLALDRPVSITGLGLGLSSRGITLDVGPVIIADDAAFTTQPFIKIDKVRLSVDLRSLIFQHVVHVTDIVLQSPQIHFIRSQEGIINIHSIGQASRSTGNNTIVTAIEAKPRIEAAAPPSGIHRETSKKNHGFLEDIRSLEITDGSISYIDQNKAIPLDIWLSSINVHLNDFSVSKPFRSAFDACLYSDAPNVHGSSLMSLGQEGSGLKITDLKLDTDLSSIGIEGLKGISPGLSDSLFSSSSIAGKVEFNISHLDFNTAGLMADGEMAVTDGVIRNFNMVKMLLSHMLTVFGGIGLNIDRLFNGQNKLGAPDTVIQKADVKFSLHDKSVSIDESSLETNIFELEAKGTIDQGLNTDMQTTLHLNQDVSASLINELNGLKYLCDDSKRIVIVASLTGVIPHLKYKPNKEFRKKSRKALMQEGGNILGILLGAAPVSVQGQDNSPQEGKKVKKNFKNIFKSLLQ